MIIIDEYLALRAITSGPVDGLPSEDVFGLTYLRHWRLISTIAHPAKGQLSKRLANYSNSVHRFIQQPDPGFLQLIDPLRLNLAAASYLTVLGPINAMNAETIAACIEYDSALYIGSPRNGVGRIADKYRQAGIKIVDLS